MSQSKSKILVVGGAGYIGSHTTQALQQAGYETIVLDNLVCGHRDLVENVLQSELIVGDIGDRALLDRLFATRSITAVMHFAAYAYVGESFQEPAKYYRNNVAQTITLLEAMVAASIDNLVFSSTCATYGIPQQIPITEDTPQQPLNPYGASKLMCERIIRDFEIARVLKSVIFRFFNAAGADPLGRLGEDHTPEPHLIPSAMLAALGQRSMAIYGTDYPTPDGTCIRDYIHVSDLAQAHVQGLEYLLEQKRSNIFNLGNEKGFSVREILETTQKITGKKIKVVESDRRPGDPPRLVASSEKARNILGWHPQYPDLKDILTSAWNWHQKRHSSKEPLVSVIIPAYNAERFIARTLQSVLAQTYTNLEVIVVDDGSGDGTAQIVKSIAQTDRRIIFLQQPNLGVAAARNLGISKSTGEFIAPIDADDLWYPENIVKQVQQMQSDSSVGLVYSWSVDIDENDALLGGFRAAKIEGEVYNTLVCHNFIGNASASLIRRSCLGKANPYNCEMKLQNAQGCEDWELYLRIAENYQFRVVPEFLVGYRKLLSSMSGDYNQMAKSHASIMQTVRQKHPHLPAIVYRLSSSNLYMYFAHQSNRCNKHRVTLFWLYEALQADLITPFLRLGLYRLSIASISGSIAQLVMKLTGRTSQVLSSDRHNQLATLTKTDIEQQKLLINLMIIVGNLFHQIIDIMTAEGGQAQAPPILGGERLTKNSKTKKDSKAISIELQKIN